MVARTVVRAELTMETPMKAMEDMTRLTRSEAPAANLNLSTKARCLESVLM